MNWSLPYNCLNETAVAAALAIRNGDKREPLVPRYGLIQAAEASPSMGFCPTLGHQQSVAKGQFGAVAAYRLSHLRRCQAGSIAILANSGATHGRYGRYLELVTGCRRERLVLESSQRDVLL